MIIAIVTLYNPNKKVLRNLEFINQQVDKMFLCDNSKTIHNEYNSLFFNCEYIYFNENRGLSKAFNYILKDNKYNWNDKDKFIFFDQDSNIPKNLIKDLSDAFDYLNKNNYEIGCIGPDFININDYQEEKKIISNNLMKVDHIITSSLLTNYEKLKKINFWNEDFFLDFADYDLCYRFNYSKMYCYIKLDSLFFHELGQSVKKVGMINILNEKPFREYYIVREGLKIIVKKYTPIKHKIGLLKFLTFDLLLRILFLPEKKERFVFAVKGFRDFTRNINTEVKN